MCGELGVGSWESGVGSGTYGIGVDYEFGFRWRWRWRWHCGGRGECGGCGEFDVMGVGWIGMLTMFVMGCGVMNCGGSFILIRIITGK